MKRYLCMLALAAAGSLQLVAKDIRTVVFTTRPEMHCQRCENRIKSNIRFEKGVKFIETDLKTKRVKVTFDADKTTVENIRKGFEKIHYQTTTVEEKAVEKKE